MNYYNSTLDRNVGPPLYLYVHTTSDWIFVTFDLDIWPLSYLFNSGWLSHGYCHVVNVKVEKRQYVGLQFVLHDDDNDGWTCWCLGRDCVDNARHTDSTSQWRRPKHPDSRLTDVVCTSTIQLLRLRPISTRRRLTERTGSHRHWQTDIPAAWWPQWPWWHHGTWRGMSACHGSQVSCFCYSLW